MSTNSEPILFDEAAPLPKPRATGGPIYRTSRFEITREGRLVATRGGGDYTSATENVIVADLKLGFVESHRGPDRRIEVFCDGTTSLWRVFMGDETFWMPATKYETKSIDGLMLARRMRRQMARTVA